MKVTIMYCGSWDGVDPTIHYPIDIEIFDICPKCGVKRGKSIKTIDIESDGKYEVDVWVNPCNHIDYPRNVYDEAKRIKKDTRGIACQK